MPVNGLSIQYWQFQTPKRGERVEDNEDASAADAAHGRFAIADGAAGSSYSALWARLLVEEYIHAPNSGAWSDWLPAVQRRWESLVARRPGQSAMPWFVEDRMQQGAFAAFLGLVLDEVTTWRGGKRKRWRALAVGDTCLFQVRAGRLYHSVPMTRSRDFGNSPWLAGSRTVLDRKFSKQAAQYKGGWQPGDRLWLMTDALALWFLQEAEAGHKPWKELEALLLRNDPQRSFPGWVEDMRDSQRIRNDDVTLLALCL
jgi:hypothetical protein